MIDKSPYYANIISDLSYPKHLVFKVCYHYESDKGYPIAVNFASSEKQALRIARRRLKRFNKYGHEEKMLHKGFRVRGVFK
jgi:hypothetical protein